MSYICQSCNNRVDTDLDEFTEEAINNTLCTKCQEMGNKNKGYPQKTIGDLLQEIEDLKSQKAALLAACKLAADQAGRASLVQDRSVGIIKQVCAIIAKDLKSVIEQAGESGE